jgi:rhodanese-related sulfurtransferase
MMEVIKNLFGFGPSIDYKKLVQAGATIVDVRTKSEYDQGHVKGSINIPLGNLQNQFTRIPKTMAVITCCASGMRSGQAKGFLLSHGYSEVHNGGGWIGLKQKLER